MATTGARDHTPTRNEGYGRESVVVHQDPHMIGGWPVGPREIALVNEVLASGVIFSGEKTKRFEELIAAAHDRRVAIFMNSGTSALDCAVHAMKRERGWKDGDEVLVPAITFVQTYFPLMRLGLKPVIVDVTPEHFDIDVDQIERHITPRTVGIVPVHLFGQPCEIDRVMEIADAHDLGVIEDSCEAMYVKRHGRVVGSWGDIACFSTFTVHQVATGVGGFLLTSDERLALVAKQVMNHGSSKWSLSFDDEDRPVWSHPMRGWGYDDIGYSHRATDLEAALGIAQVERWPEIVGGYQRNAERLVASLSDLGDHLQLPSVREGSEHGWFRVGLVIKDRSISRDEFMDHLAANDVHSQYLFPITTQPVFADLVGDDPGRDFPAGDLIAHQGLNIGCHIGLSDADLDRASEVIHDFFAGR